jgi:hypothetical protein
LKLAENISSSRQKKRRTSQPELRHASPDLPSSPKFMFVVLKGG